MTNVTFAPKDMNPVNFNAKDDLHGIGYQPMSVQPKPKSSSAEEERLTFGGHRKGISGQVLIYFWLLIKLYFFVFAVHFVCKSVS